MIPAGGGRGGGGHRRGLVLAAVATALVLLVVAVTLHMRLTQDDPAQPVSPRPAAGPSGTGAAGLAAPPGGQARLLTGEQVAWSRYCGVDLPHAPRLGPSGRDGDRRYGFATTAGGAVVAAAHLLVQVSPQTGPDVFATTIAEQVVGPDIDLLAQAVHADYEQAIEAAQVPYGQPVCPIYARLAGFVIDSHTTLAASLRLLVQGPGPDGSPQWASLLVQLTWVDGDWRLVAPPLGNWSRLSTLLPAAATDSFVPLRPGE